MRKQVFGPDALISPLLANENMRVKIKICGLSRKSDIEAVNEAKPDYIGFVFAESLRQVSKEEAYELKALLSPEITVVGVFVDSPVRMVEELLKEKIIDMAQLHGGESGDYIRKLQQETGREIIKAIKIKSAEELKEASGSPADYLLLDGGAGSGKTFDWNCILKIKPEKPFFLAGGLCSENVTSAVKKVSPYGVDLSSGVETNGLKDREKILEIVRRVKNV